MKKIFLLLMIVIIMMTAGAACPGKSEQSYNLCLQYQFTPGMETFSTITGTYSDPAQTTFHGYQYSLSVEPPESGGLAMAISGTPAIWAGTTVMRTVDGYSARPPGT